MLRETKSRSWNHGRLFFCPECREELAALACLCYAGELAHTSSPEFANMFRRCPFALVSVFALLMAVSFATAAEKTGFITKTYQNADGKPSPYVVFVPHDYDGTKPYPVMLFLHGSGETKGGTKQPAEVGIGPAIKKREKNFPFLVVIPQSQNRTWKADSADGKRALAILDEVQKRYKVDPRRVYLTALSMGGY